jgi:putative ABC transport system permease protein
VKRRDDMMKDLDQDIRNHIEVETQDNIERGMSLEEARRAAMLKFGNATRVREDTREVWSWIWLEQLLQDIRYGMRMLRKNPGFTAIVVLTLALGIGANTAIFSVVYAVLLKPLPYTHSEQLFTVFQQLSKDESSATGWSYANLEDLREQNHVFSEVAGSQHHQLTLTGHGEASVVNASVVTGDFFTLFAEKPLAGRAFFPEDGKAGAPAVVILSENLWRSTFGADPAIIGKSIELDKRSFTIVGIMPTRFRFPLVTESEQVWVPLVQDPLFGGWMGRRGGHWLQVTGRLNPGVSTAQARAELNAIGIRLAKDFPKENDGWMIQMIPLQQLLVFDVKSALFVLLGAVGLVLLIACANIANLLLTRATSRAREMAVRSTLGAGRNRIVRQLLSETAILGLLGGAAGIALAYWGVQSLASLLPAAVPQVNPIRVDKFVLCFALLLSAVASFAFGLAPALFAANAHLQTNLREGGGRSGESAGRHRARSFFAAAEIALAMILLVAAGLLMRSFAKLTSVNPGFDVQRVMKANIALPRTQYSTPQQWTAFADDLLARIQAQPGVQESAFAVPTPMDGEINLGFDVVGSPSSSEAESKTADYVSVTQNYFHLMGIPLMSGRFFNEGDVSSSPRVTVISRALARRYFPNQDPLGKQLSFGFPPDGVTTREVVGIVGDVRDMALDHEPGPMMYVPYAQAPFPGADLVVKSASSASSASSVSAAIRESVGQIDKDLPLGDIAEMPNVVEGTVAQPRFRTFLLGLFAAMALILAATGIFGVISYSVSCRTREIGIRVALGASRPAILRMVLRETLLLTFARLAVGIPCALAASRLVAHMLFGVSAHDPATLVAVAVTLSLVAALAGFIPARRAMRVNPTVALKYE